MGMVLFRSQQAGGLISLETRLMQLSNLSWRTPYSVLSKGVLCMCLSVCACGWWVVGVCCVLVWTVCGLVCFVVCAMFVLCTDEKHLEVLVIFGVHTRYLSNRWQQPTSYVGSLHLEGRERQEPLSRRDCLQRRLWAGGDSRATYV